MIERARKVLLAVLSGGMSKKDGIAELSSLLSKARSDLARGYCFGARAILTKQPTDEYALDPTKLPKRDVRYVAERLREYAEFRFHDEFDRGYFAAWVDYLSYLQRARGRRGD
ncbi:hypothetical protein B6U99_01400 [Candidatus Geothermarchaeota archaeon ex4572_27]|nr:MAG: hypothetical protein B6U99_01400 [Candidatus Geothermarchaeota archaeon ex4572_27]